MKKGAKTHSEGTNSIVATFFKSLGVPGSITTSGAYWQARDMILEFHFDSRWAQRDDGFVD